MDSKPPMMILWAFLILNFGTMCIGMPTIMMSNSIVTIASEIHPGKMLTHFTDGSRGIGTHLAWTGVHRNRKTKTIAKWVKTVRMIVAIISFRSLALMSKRRKNIRSRDILIRPMEMI